MDESERVATSNRPSICLCMIVKDEVDVLSKCLRSCRDLIDYWVICDTGSTDGTQGLIQGEMDGIAGKLHQHEWVNFGHNRSELMNLARGRADYLLLLDADTAVEVEPGALEGLNADAYLLAHAEGDTRYYTKRLVSGQLDWHYVGVVHEYIVSDQERNTGRLEGVTIRSHSVGGVRKGRWRRDAELLEAELERNPGDPRSLFYLAQTYRDIGLHSKDQDALMLARDRYEQRARLAGWEEETYCAWRQSGVLSARLGDWPRAVDAFITAWETRPTRLEAVHDLVVGLLDRRQHHAAQRFTLLASGLRPLPVPDDILFLEPWIYEWGLLFQHSIALYWCGEYDASVNACKRLLAIKALPDSHRKQTVANMQHAIRERARLISEQPPPAPRQLPHTGTPTRGRPANGGSVPEGLRDPALAKRLATLCDMSVRDVERQLLTVGSTTSVTVEALGGWPLRLRPGTEDVRALDEVCNGLSHLPSQALDDPHLILDIGSGIGIAVAHFAHRYPTARIVAVEPDRANQELCKTNLKPLRDRVTLIEAAIAPRNSKRTGDAEGVTLMTLDTLIANTADDTVVDHMNVEVGKSEGLLLRTDGRWPSRVLSLKLALRGNYPLDEARDDLRRLGFISDGANGWVSGTRSEAKVPRRIRRLSQR